MGDHMKKISRSILMNVLVEKRTEKKLTRSQLASIVGMDYSTIESLEKGICSASIEQLEKLGDALEFELTDLIENIENPLKNNLSRFELENKKYRIVVVGTGYVGLSLAVLLAQNNYVTAVDIIPEKVNLINNRISPIKDDYIEMFFSERDLDLSATIDPESAYKEADYVIIAVQTNYDCEKNCFDTSAVESVIEEVLKVNSNVIIVIKSTVPVGFTLYVRNKYNTKNIIFSPEFLRESKALYDNLYPSRIIVSVDDSDRIREAAYIFATLLRRGAIKEDIDTLFIGSTEAEAVKLFANTYLALRVSFFNELDTYAEIKGLNTLDIIL